MVLLQRGDDMIIDYKDVLEYWGTQKPIRSGKTLYIAIEDAIEKQIEREPIIETVDIIGRPLKHISYACPRCKVSVNSLIDSPYCYCSKCGQAIDKSKMNH